MVATTNPDPIGIGSVELASQALNIPISPRKSPSHLRESRPLSIGLGGCIYAVRACMQFQMVALPVDGAQPQYIMSLPDNADEPILRGTSLVGFLTCKEAECGLT